LLATRDQLVRARAIMALDRLRQSGATILFTSNDEDLLLELADEIWWLKEGRLIGARRSRRSPGRLSCSHHAAHPGLGDRVFRPRFRHDCAAATGVPKFWPLKLQVKTGNLQRATQR
jgi:energy-coupling factor transporter ATP-binding protein EcfA2